jgi:hypothetical protein
MARQPKVEPWPPLNDASKLAYLEILFSSFSLISISTALIHLFLGLSTGLSNKVAFQNPFQYVFSIHTLDMTCPL